MFSGTRVLSAFSEQEGPAVVPLQILHSPGTRAPPGRRCLKQGLVTSSISFQLWERLKTSTRTCYRSKATWRPWKVWSFPRWSPGYSPCSMWSAWFGLHARVTAVPGGSQCCSRRYATSSSSRWASLVIPATSLGTGWPMKEWSSLLFS